MRFLVAMIFCLVSLNAECLLTHPPYGPGFFSVFNTVVGALDSYDKNEISGLRVDFENVGHYFDESYGENWWNYYFEPIHLGNHGARRFKTYEKISLSQKAQFVLSRERFSELLGKYVVVKSHVQQKVDVFIKENFANHKVLGIHYRGTDKKSEAPVVSYLEMRDLIEREIEEGLFTKVFVATDDANFLDFLKREFPGIICCIEALRSSDGSPVHISQMPPYQKGEEALIDCLLLSKVDKLCKMASNLSDVSMKWNCDLDVHFINKSFAEQEVNKKYSPVKAFMAILSLFDEYEEGKRDPLSVYLPACESGENDVTNWTDHFFEPVSLRGDVITLKSYDVTVRGLSYLYSKNHERKFEIIQKYMTFKPEIMEKVDATTKIFGDRPFMGVYYTDLEPRVLQKPEGFGKVFNLIDAELEKNPRPIYLVSTNVSFLREASLRYPGIVGVPQIGKRRKVFEFEEEVFVDALVFSKSDTFISIASGMTELVKSLNPSVKVETLSEHWLTQE